MHGLFHERTVPLFQIYFVCKYRLMIMYQKVNWLVTITSIA